MKNITTTIALTTSALIGLSSYAAAGDRTFGNGNLPERLVAQIDADGDGEITVEEIQAWKQARRDQRSGRGPSSWDTDGDGTVSKEERDAARDELRARVVQMRADRHAEADEDGDGSLSIEEFSAIPAVAKLAERNPELVQKIYDRLDRDGEGGITADEFTSHLGGLRPMNPRPDRPSPPDHPGGQPDPRPGPPDPRPGPPDPRPGPPDPHPGGGGGEDPGGEDPGGEDPGGEDPGGEDPGGEDPGAL